MSNQVRDPAKIDRLARLPRYGARIVVCVDDLANVAEPGLKAQSVDSGLPFVYGRDDVQYVKCSDEHGVIDDPTAC